MTTIDIRKMSRVQREIHIKMLRSLADRAFVTYERSFRHIGANDDECAVLSATHSSAQAALSEAIKIDHEIMNPWLYTVAA